MSLLLGVIWGINMGIGFMALIDWWFDRREDARREP